MSIIAPGTPAPDFPLKREDGERLHPGRPQGPHDRPGLLPVRLQPGLHRPVPDLRGGRWRTSRAQARTLYGVSTDADLVAEGVQGEARHHDPAAVGLRAQGRDVAQARRLLRARRHDEPRDRDLRRRRRRAVVAPRRLARASCPASNLILDGLRRHGLAPDSGDAASRLARRYSLARSADGDRAAPSPSPSPGSMRTRSTARRVERRARKITSARPIDLALGEVAGPAGADRAAVDEDRAASRDSTAWRCVWPTTKRIGRVARRGAQVPAARRLDERGLVDHDDVDLADSGSSQPRKSACCSWVMSAPRSA